MKLLIKEYVVIIIKLVMDSILKQFKRFTLSCLLVVVCLIAIIFSLVAYVGQGYGYSKCNDLLSSGFAGTGILEISFESFTGENCATFLEEAYEREEIAAIGDAYIYETTILPELYGIQKMCTDGFFTGEQESLQVLCMNMYLWDMCDMQLEEGTEPEQIQMEQYDEYNRVEYLYLGSAYSTIPIGKEYKYGNEHYSVTYKVVGRLAESQRWIDPNLVEEMNMGDLDYTIDCSYAVISVTNSRPYYGAIWVSAQEGYTIEDAILAADDVALENDISLKYATLSERYENSSEDNRMLMTYLGRLLCVIIPSAIVMLITMQIVSILSERENYGIMCAQGFSLKDIEMVLVVKNIIMAIGAFFVAMPVILWVEKKWFNEDVQYILRTVLVSDALPCAIIVILLVILVTSITALIVIKKSTPIQLMKYKR